MVRRLPRGVWALPIFLAAGALFIQYLPYLAMQREHGRRPAAMQPEAVADIPQAPQEGGPVLVIPALALKIPIVLEVDGQSTPAYDDALTRGVAQLKDSAPLLGQTGNTVIFGHSSYLRVAHSPYDSIFATLPQLQVGDQFLVQANGRSVRYSVTLSQSSSATNVSLVAPSSSRQITLLTCWPIGLSLKRWVIVGTPA